MARVHTLQQQQQQQQQQHGPTPMDLAAVVQRQQQQPTPMDVSRREMMAAAVQRRQQQQQQQPTPMDVSLAAAVQRRQQQAAEAKGEAPISREAAFAIAAAKAKDANDALLRAKQWVSADDTKQYVKMANLMSAIGAAVKAAEDEIERLGIAAVGKVFYDETKSEHVRAAGRMNQNGVTDAAQRRTQKKATKQFKEAEESLVELRLALTKVTKKLTNVAVARNKDEREGESKAEDEKADHEVQQALAFAQRIVANAKKRKLARS